VASCSPRGRVGKLRTTCWDGHDNSRSSLLGHFEDLLGWLSAIVKFTTHQSLWEVPREFIPYSNSCPFFFERTLIPLCIGILECLLSSDPLGQVYPSLSSRWRVCILELTWPRVTTIKLWWKVWESGRWSSKFGACGPSVFRFVYAVASGMWGCSEPASGPPCLTVTVPGVLLGRGIPVTASHR
jgi:hypothetical protein